MKIETLSTASLIPYARNAKKHDASQVAKLAGSIREFGFNNPVLVDKDNGIIAGHGRIMAAQSLGLETVPCIRLGHLTDTQRRAYILADNRLAEIGGGWDEEMLKLELADLRELDMDFNLMGFDASLIEEKLNPSEPSIQSLTPESSAKEIDVDSFDMDHRCPRCGFETDKIGKYMIGMSVPPKMTEAVARAVIDQWLL